MVSLAKFPVHPLVLAAIAIVPMAMFFGGSPPLSTARVSIGFMPVGGRGQYVVVDPTVANALDSLATLENPASQEATMVAYNTQTRRLYYMTISLDDAQPTMVDWDPMTKTVMFQTTFTRPSVIFAMEYNSADNTLYAIGSVDSKNNLGLYAWTPSTSALAGSWLLQADVTTTSDLVGVMGISAIDTTNQDFYFISTAQNGLVFTLNKLNLVSRTVTQTMSLGSTYITSMEYDAVAQTLLAIIPAERSTGNTEARVAVIDPFLGTYTTVGMLPERKDPLLYTTTFDLADEVIVVGTQPRQDPISSTADVKLTNYLFNNQRNSGGQMVGDQFAATQGKGFGTATGHRAPYPMQSILPHVAHADSTRRQINEDTTLNLQTLFRIESPDTTDFYNVQLRVHLTSKQGCWLWVDNDIKSGTKTTPTLPAESNRKSSITLYGNHGYINSELGYLFYQGYTHFNSEQNGTDTVTITVQSQKYSLATSSSAVSSNVYTTDSSYGKIESTQNQDIWVEYVNDAPYFTGKPTNNPEEIKTKWSRFTFSTLQVFDVDVNDKRPTPNIKNGENVDYIMEWWGKAAHGTLQVQSIEGLTFLTGGERAQEIKIRGEMQFINKAIKGLTYDQDSTWDNTDTVDMYINDLGNTGQGFPALQDDYKLTINVKYKNTLVVKPNPAFSADGASIIVEFFEATNRANMGNAEGSCSTLFDTPTLAKFGTNVKCQWETDRQLLVKFFPATPNTSETAPSILPDETIHLLGQNEGGVLAGKDGQTYNNLSDLPTVYPVQRPAVPATPRAVLNSVSQIDKCKGVEMDALKSEGGGMRLFKKYVWGLVSAPEANKAAIQAIIDEVNAKPAADATRVVIPAADMTQRGTFTFSLQVTNFLDAVSPVAERSMTKTSIGIPAISFTPSTQKVFTTIDNIVIATVNPSECDTADTPLPVMTFEYTSVAVADPKYKTFAPDSATKNSQNLKVVARTLEPGFSYRVKLTGTVTSTNPNVITDQTMDLFVARSGLEAVIAGGTKDVGIREALTVDAGENSKDPDLVTTLATDFQYRWKCQMVTPSGDCRAAIRTQFLYDATDNPQWTSLSGTTFPGTVDGSTSLFNVGEVYDISVDIRRTNFESTSDTRVATTKVRYTIVQFTPLQTTITRLGSSQLSDVSREVGFGVVVTVGDADFVTSTATATWSLVSTDGESTIDVTNSALAQTIVNAERKQYTLSVGADVLVVKKTYVAKVEIKDTLTGGTQREATTQMSVFVRPGPTGGSFSVSPCSVVNNARVCTPCDATSNVCGITAISQEVVFDVGGAWKDYNGNTNLKYTYFTTVSGGSLSEPETDEISDAITGGQQSTYFSALEDNQTIVAGVLVTDEIGATTTVTRSVQVTFTQPIDNTALVASATSNINALATSGLYNAGYGLLTSSMTTIFNVNKGGKAITTEQTTSFYLSLTTLDVNTPVSAITASGVGLQMAAINSFLDVATTLGADEIEFSQKFALKRVKNLNSMSQTTFKRTMKLVATTNGSKNRPASSSSTVKSILELSATTVLKNVVVGGQSITMTVTNIALTLKKVDISALGGSGTTIGTAATGTRRRLLATAQPSITLPGNVKDFASPATGWDNSDIQSFALDNPHSTAISSNSIASQVIRYGLFVNGDQVVVRGMSEPNLVTYKVPVDTTKCDGVSDCAYVCMQYSGSLNEWDSGSCSTTSSQPAADGTVQCKCTQLADTAVHYKSTSAGSSDDLSSGAWAGIIIGAVVVVGLIVIAAYLVVSKRAELKAERAASEAAAQQSDAPVVAAGAGLGVAASTKSTTAATAGAGGSSDMLTRALESQPPAAAAATASTSDAAELRSAPPAEETTPDTADEPEDAPAEEDVEAAMDSMADALDPDANAAGVTAEPEDADVEDVPASAEAVEDSAAAADAEEGDLEGATPTAPVPEPVVDDDEVYEPYVANVDSAAEAAAAEDAPVADV